MIGSRGVGKSNILKRLLSGDFESKYVVTLVSEEKKININTNYGMIKFNILECVNSSELNDIKTNFNGCIGVIEKGNETSVNYLKQELNNNLFENMPVVTIVNKIELKTNKVHLELFPDAILVSAINNYNLDEPFLIIAKKLSGLNDLIIVENPPIYPPVVSLEAIILAIELDNKNAIKKYYTKLQNNYQAAANCFQMALELLPGNSIIDEESDEE